MNDRDEYSDVWAEVIAAVEFLREGLRPGLTVWGALNEAIEAWLKDDLAPSAGGPPAWTDPDPLQTNLEVMLRTVAGRFIHGSQNIAMVLDAALGSWLDDVRVQCNHNQPFRRLEAKTF